MKKFLLKTVLANIMFATLISQAQIINIPDANLKNALLNLEVAAFEDFGEDDDPTLSAVDTNNDNEIDMNEATAVFGLFLDYESIASLEGIQHFVNITFLSCSANSLSTLDVSQNVNLRTLRCLDNNLSSINLSQNGLLETLVCYNNDIVNLDLSQNTNLTKLFCDENPLTSLDVSQSLSLEHLDCTRTDLETINLNNNTALIQLLCSDTKLTSIDVSQNVLLQRLSIGRTQLTSLDVSSNTVLSDLICRENSLLTVLNLGDGSNLSRMHAEDCPSLTCIQIGDLSIPNGRNCLQYSGWCIDSAVASYSLNCEALGVEDFSESLFEIYPNPVIDVLNLKSTENIELMEVYNIVGKKVITKNNVTTNKIDLSGLASGVYFVKTRINKKNTIHKVIKK